MDEALTQDHLLDGRVRLSQPKTGYRVGIDPVFLAAAVPAQAGEQVLDVGSGSGAAALCLGVRLRSTLVTGIDIDLNMVRLATANAEANAVADRVRFFLGDVAAPPIRLSPASFDHVMANPPFLPDNEGRRPREAGKVVAKLENGVTLDAWVSFCLKMVRPTGSVTIIHRADRLADLLSAIDGRLGGIVLIPLWPGGTSERAAKRLILHGRRGSNAPLSLVPGLVLHRADGRYTDAAEAILRQAEALAP